MTDSLNKRKKEIIWRGILSLFLFGYSGFFMLQSPNSIFSKVPEFIDSGVFQYIGKGILKGNMPYATAFDHKGPLLYLINAFGLKLSDPYGLWIVEWLILFAAMIVAYKACRVWFTRPASLLSVILTFSFHGLYLKGGNFTEEYAMLFCVTALYIFAKYFKEGSVDTISLIVLGMAFMGTLLLKANIAIVWVVFCFYITVASLVQKEFAKLMRYIGFFTAGCAVVLIPVLLWLGLNGALGGFFSDYIAFNLTYVEAKGAADTLEAAKFFLTDNVQLMLLLGVTVPCFAFLKHRRIFLFSLLNAVYFVLAVYLMIMPGNQYIHYGLYYMPAMLIPLALVFGFLEKMISERQMVTVCLSAVLALFLLKNVLMTNLLANLDEIQLTQNVTAGQTDLLHAISELTDEDDEIIVLGSECWIYNHADRQASSQYIYQLPISIIAPEIGVEFAEEMKENPPALIIQQGDENSDAGIYDAYGYTLKQNCGIYRIYSKK